jgi:hypothetical protein
MWGLCTCDPTGGPPKSFDAVVNYVSENAEQAGCVTLLYFTLRAHSTVTASELQNGYKLALAWHIIIEHRAFKLRLTFAVNFIHF